jgi:hypothetical protein
MEMGKGKGEQGREMEEGNVAERRSMIEEGLENH